MSEDSIKNKLQLDIKGKNILITGGNSGIGLALTKNLLALNNKVISTYREDGQNLIAINDINLSIIKLDQSDFNNFNDFEKKIEDAAIDIIRFVMSFLNQAEKEKKDNLNNSEVVKILKKLIKKNEDAFNQFSQAKRMDLAEKEKKEMEIVSRYLPEEMNEEEIINIVKTSIKNIGATTVKDMGKVMSDIKKTHESSIDMSLVSKHVKNFLS